MSKLLIFIASRIVAFVLTVAIGVTVVFVIPRLLPYNPVEAQIGFIYSIGQFYDPTAIEMLRQTLYELYGLKGNPVEQYIAVWRRLLTLDLGPSIMSFPTPVATLIGIALPWTLGLLTLSVLLSWVIGNIIGTISGFFSHKKFSKILTGMAVVLYPVPYFILALVLMFTFAFLIPIFPLGGGITIVGMGFSLDLVLNLAKHAALPAISIIIPGALGWWFLSSFTLTSQKKTEDFVRYAELKGLPNGVVLRRYLIRNILMPQTTALGLALGGIFSGALLTEVVYAYPGLGRLLYQAIINNDYNMIMGISLLSILGVSFATLLLDLLYPLIDPTVRYR
ncbi:MAG: ABC transporter permease [Nitrososphaerota archaeon]